MLSVKETKKPEGVIPSGYWKLKVEVSRAFTLASNRGCHSLHTDIFTERTHIQLRSIMRVCMRMSSPCCSIVTIDEAADFTPTMLWFDGAFVKQHGDIALVVGHGFNG